MDYTVGGIETISFRFTSIAPPGHPSEPVRLGSEIVILLQINGGNSGPSVTVSSSVPFNLSASWDQNERAIAGRVIEIVSAISSVTENEILQGFSDSDQPIYDWPRPTAGFPATDDSRAK